MMCIHIVCINIMYTHHMRMRIHATCTGYSPACGEARARVGDGAMPGTRQPEYALSYTTSYCIIHNICSMVHSFMQMYARICTHAGDFDI